MIAWTSHFVVGEVGTVGTVGRPVDEGRSRSCPNRGVWGRMTRLSEPMRRLDLASVGSEKSKLAAYPGRCRDGGNRSAAIELLSRVRRLWLRPMERGDDSRHHSDDGSTKSTNVPSIRIPSQSTEPTFLHSR